MNPARPRKSRRHPGGSWLWVVALLSIAVHAPSLGGAFLDWDDEAMFVDHAGWRGLAPSNLAWMFSTIHMAHYMPVTWLTCGLDWVLWGLDPRGYHLTSVLFHAGAAAVWWAVFRRLVLAAAPRVEPRVASLAAAVGALFWSLGPLRVESVAWITERRDVVSGLFAASVVLFWLRSLDAGRSSARSKTTCSILFALALLSKTSAMMLPAALLVLDGYPLRRVDLGWRQLLGEKRDLFVLAGLGAFVAWLGQARTPEALTSWDVLDLTQRVALAGYAWIFYAWKTFVPHGLSPLVPLDTELAPLAAPYSIAWACALAVTAALVLLRRRAPAALATWVAYTVLVAPVLGFSHAGWHQVADRYAYLPGVAFGALVAGGYAWLSLRGRARIAATGALIALVGCAALSVRQTGYWKDSETLWTRVARTRPERSVGHHRLGVARLRAGDSAAAVEALERAADAHRSARELDPRYDLARALLAAGDETRAVSALAELLAESPTHPGALLLQEALLLRSGRRDAATELYDRALAADPTFQAAGERRDSLRAGRVDSSYVETQKRTARGLLDTSHPVAAEYYLRNALALSPDDAEARALLATSLAAQSAGGAKGDSPIR